MRSRTEKVEPRKDKVSEIKEIDFSRDLGYEQSLAEEFAVRATRAIADGKDFYKLPFTPTYVNHGPTNTPGYNEFAMEANGTRLRYNEDYISDAETIENIRSEFKTSELGEEQLNELGDLLTED
ncbi:hypothetical protein [Candidatus Nanohalococcus occultus]|uniref:Uncharacterized protein n=1 Tax=Candidatus Nanohalococcus occultus TaxID=2978047 RepID=A0ABY8CKH6_9ARCH|nr:hypothetical protein SVXNc_0819 [Candidatus Nanohaloarchaeota archaeon SVXNc]